MRKTPVKHPVKGHYRDGKFIERYTRGKGEKAKAASRRESRMRGAGYSVAWLYPGGEKEAYKVSLGNPVEAAREATGLVSLGELPYKLVIRRLGK